MDGRRGWRMLFIYRKQRKPFNTLKVVMTMRECLLLMFRKLDT